MDDQYPNIGAPWMDSYAVESLSKYRFHHALFDEWIARVATIDGLMDPPLFCLPIKVETKHLAVVNGTVVGDVPAESKNHGKKARKRKRKKGPPAQAVAAGESQ
jgi:hypothetical protein